MAQILAESVGVLSELDGAGAGLFSARCACALMSEGVPTMSLAPVQACRH
jgi:hypothetical protein